MLPSILLSLLMAGCVYPVMKFGLPDPATLMIQVPLGVIVYVLASWLLKIDSFQYVLETANRMLRGRKERK